MSGVGQTEGLKSALEPLRPIKTSAPEKPELVRERVAQWAQEAKEALAKIENSAPNPQLPDGVTGAELDDHRRELESIVLITSQWMKSIDSSDDVRKSVENARAEREAWTGFKESPPYPVQILDELLNERDAIQARLDTAQASLLNDERLDQTIMDEAKAAEEMVTARVTELKNSDPSKIDAAKWRLEATRTKSRQLAARSGLLASNTRILKDRIASANADLLLTDRKVKLAKANTIFSDEDFAKLVKVADERNRASKKETEAISKRLNASKTSVSKAQAALDALEATVPPADGSVIDLAKFRLEVAQGRLESLQLIVEMLEGLPQLENLTLEAYQNRKNILSASQAQQRTDALRALEQIENRLRAWSSVLEQEISNSQEDLARLESRAASVSSEDPRFELLNEQRATHSEKLAVLERITKAVATQQRLIIRWIIEHTPKTNHSAISTQLTQLMTLTQGTIKKIWSFEVMNFEDHIVVDGQTLARTIPVTLGMLLRALLFFVITYSIFSKIANRIQKTLVVHGHITDAQAKTLRNWLMIAVGILLAIGTLSFLKIPLTVFAFFGGALAIGLGFGTQTLIKNFISGIIVLFERKIRVGDVLDIDGIIGTVTEINTRSSIIRSADDVETIIPNSLFLENRVTNWTLSNSRIRRNLRVLIAYGTPPQKVIQVLMECAAQHPSILKHPKSFATFEEFGERAMTFSLYFWLDLEASTNTTVITSELRTMMAARFADEGIHTHAQPILPA